MPLNRECVPIIALVGVVITFLGVGMLWVVSSPQFIPVGPNPIPLEAFMLPWVFFGWFAIIIGFLFAGGIIYLYYKGDK